MANPTPEQIMAQASAIANQGGPGANQSAADSWLQQQFKSNGYKIQPTKGANDSGPYDFYGGGISGGVGGTIGKPPDNYDVYKDPKGQAGSVDGFSWIQTHAANYGLVIFGALLALGALLISQRNTIVQVGKTVAEVAA